LLVHGKPPVPSNREENPTESLDNIPRFVSQLCLRPGNGIFPDSQKDDIKTSSGRTSYRHYLEVAAHPEEPCCLASP
jgi:hypothetical protein